MPSEPIVNVAPPSPAVYVFSPITISWFGVPVTITLPSLPAVTSFAPVIVMVLSPTLTSVAELPFTDAEPPVTLTAPSLSIVNVAPPVPVVYTVPPMVTSPFPSVVTVPVSVFLSTSTTVSAPVTVISLSPILAVSDSTLSISAEPSVRIKSVLLSLKVNVAPSVPAVYVLPPMTTLPPLFPMVTSFHATVVLPLYALTVTEAVVLPSTKEISVSAVLPSSTVNSSPCFSVLLSARRKLSPVSSRVTPLMVILSPAVYSLMVSSST